MVVVVRGEMLKKVGLLWSKVINKCVAHSEPSILNLSSVCLSVCLFDCLSRFVLPGHTHQYLIQIKSELHETFRISSWWSPELIYNVCVRASARVHAQHVNTCMLFL